MIGIEARPGDQLHRFHGGLKLRHHKRASLSETLTLLPLPDELVIPVSQHLGPAGEALVRAGDTVLGGQAIAHAEGIPGSWVHAPTSGTVIDVGTRPVPSADGLPASCVILKPDHEDRHAGLPPMADFLQADPSTLLERIDLAGIAGMGGAVFPTAIKLMGGQASDIHTLVLNGAECEPYIACDETLMRLRPDSVVRGAQVLQRLLGGIRVVIAIEDQMGGVRQILDAAIREQQAQDIEVIKVTTIYPEGGERQLIEVLTGRQVPSGGLPQDLGLLVQNVATAAAAGDAVAEGRPLTRRIVTVSGPGIRQPCNLEVRLGTPVAELVAAAGGYAEDVQRLLMGGPLMGVALGTDAVPVTKAFNCALALRGRDIAERQPEMPCINCGECVRVCPASLLPQALHWHIRAGQYDEVEKLNLADCIECGCCDLVCPSHIPLVDYYRYGKAEMRQQARERQAAELARERFEFRELRLEREKQERRAAREARKRELASQADRQASIEAAVRRAAEKRRSPGGDKTEGEG